MRYLTPLILKDLSKKMVLLSGPRQCGKTTLAEDILKNHLHGTYLNWDFPGDQKKVIRQDWPENHRLIVLDEIHKYKRWKTWLKGLYDKTKTRHTYLVTGSARLDTYRRGGESMLGRFHHWRLHPFCLAELPKGITLEEGMKRLMEFGGFPEPFLEANPIESKRWRRERLELVIRQDVRDLENIKDITLLTLLVELLRDRVSGPTVYSNLAEDLDVAPKTVKHWIEILEKMYLLFRVLPLSKNLPRAIKKTPKIYFYDIADVTEKDDPGPRFENLVACHLLKRIQFLEDSTGDRYQLSYLQDKEDHEVDFVILKNQKPLCLVESKWSDPTPDSSLVYYREKLKIPHAIQLVRNLKEPIVRKGVSIVPAAQWLSQPLSRPIEECLR